MADYSTSYRDATMQPIGQCFHVQRRSWRDLVVVRQHECHRLASVDSKGVIMSYAIGGCTMLRSLLALLVSATFLIAEASAQTCDERSATKAIDDFMISWETFPKGKVTVINDFAQGGGGKQMRFQRYKAFQELAKFGLVRIVAQPKQGPGGWAQYLDATVGGILEQIDVAPLEIKHAPGYKETNDSFSVPQGEFKVERVVKRDSLRGGAESYCLVHFLHLGEWNRFLWPFLLALGTDPIHHQRKGRVLLKLDPFTDAWKGVAGDYTDRDKDFTSDDVGDFVRKNALNRSP